MRVGTIILNSALAGATLAALPGNLGMSWVHASVVNASWQPAAESSAEPLPGERRDLPFDFARVTNRLDEAVEVLDEMDTLERKRWFGRDQRDAQTDMDKLISDALDLLDVAGASTMRDDIRANEARIAAAHTQIADLRRRRVSAPTAEELSVMERVTLTTTREGIDASIAAREAEIVVAERAIAETKARLVTELNAIGLTLTNDGAEALLGSVTGDDYLRMAVVFDNFRRMTVELERLVAQSAEAPDQSRRYYGMYTLLVRMLSNMETAFIEKVRSEYVPRLDELSESARSLIAEAEQGLRSSGGDPAIARTYQRNIESNRLTYEVSQDYARLLQSQASTVEMRNKHTQRQLEAALNTYRTVRISADVADLIGQSRSSFDALINLEMPGMRQFENERVRAEFERLTKQLKTQ